MLLRLPRARAAARAARAAVDAPRTIDTAAAAQG